MPIAVVMGVFVHLIVANLIGAEAGQYAGFAVTIGCVTWFMVNHERGTRRFNAVASLVAAMAGVLVLYALHSFPSDENDWPYNVSVEADGRIGPA